MKCNNGSSREARTVHWADRVRDRRYNVVPCRIARVLCPRVHRRAVVKESLVYHVPFRAQWCRAPRRAARHGGGGISGSSIGGTVTDAVTDADTGTSTGTGTGTCGSRACTLLVAGARLESVKYIVRGGESNCEPDFAQNVVTVDKEDTHLVAKLAACLAHERIDVTAQTARDARFRNAEFLKEYMRGASQTVSRIRTKCNGT